MNRQPHLPLFTGLQDPGGAHTLGLKIGKDGINTVGRMTNGQSNGDRQHRFVFKMNSILASGNWGHGFRKTTQKLLSTRIKRPDLHPDLFIFCCVSRPVRRNSLNATGVYTEHLTGRAHTHNFSRANTTAHHPHISKCGHTTFGFRRDRVRVFFSGSHPSRSLMSLLNVPFVRFPSVFSSPTAPSSRPSASTTSMARSCRNRPSAHARWSESGRMADQVPNTNIVQVKTLAFAFSPQWSGLCFVFRARTFFCWWTAIAMRMATAVLGRKSL